MDAARRLKELRLSKNLTTTQLATRCNMQQSTISKLETGMRVIDVPTLTLLCDVLDVSLADFFHYEPLPVHIHELVDTCKHLTPEQIALITLSIKALLSK